MLRLPVIRELRRYSDIARTVDMLLNKHLPLTSAASWPDRNDAYFIQQYEKRRPNVEAVRIACFTKRRETFHHWKVFSAGTSGICQVFDGPRLMKFVDGHPNLRGGMVKYLSSAVFAKKTAIINEGLPFVKRTPYGDEGEYRVIHEDVFPCGPVFNVAFPLEIISRLVVSPETPEALYLSIKRTLQLIPGCRDIRVTRSLLTDTPAFQRALDEHLRRIDGDNGV